MITLRLLLTGTLIASLIDPLAANAWQLRGGGGGRSFVMPRGGNVHGVPPGPAPHPMPAPHPGPSPHPGPPPPPPHGDDWYHPWAAAAVVAGTTAAVIAIGTRVTAIPPGCVSVVANSIAYQHCGATWYQPQYVGSTVQFVVVRGPW